jgi:ATP phosphoribosyltransferase
MTLKIAIPNKGSLAEASTAIFRAAGYRQRHDIRDLIFLDPENDIEFYYLRPRDIATYVGNGELDLGITGRDLLLDSRASAIELLDLEFGRSSMRFATPQEKEMVSLQTLAGKRIATSYPNLVSDFLKKRGIVAEIVQLDGAIEGAVKLGVAEVVADVVATGSTLRQAGLLPFGDEILTSTAILIARAREDRFELLVRRLQGVVFARQYVLIDYDVSKSSLASACQVTPGFESPTISPLEKEDWFAVRAMVPRHEMHKIMDRLYDLGARGILVTEIHSCRL